MLAKVKSILTSESAKKIGKEIVVGVVTYVAIAGVSLAIGTIASAVEGKLFPSGETESSPTGEVV